MSEEEVGRRQRGALGEAGDGQKHLTQEQLDPLLRCLHLLSGK